MASRKWRYICILLCIIASCLLNISRHPLEHIYHHPPGLEEIALVRTEEDESRLMHRQEDSTVPSQKPARGILWVHHISKTGGSAVQKHITQFLRKRENSAAMTPILQQWRHGDAIKHLPADTSVISRDSEVADHCQAVLDEIEEWLNQPPSPRKPLLIVHHHIACGGMLHMAPIIQRFRSKIESQGGALHLSTLLRQPLAQLVSHMTFRGILTESDWEQALLNERYLDNFQARFLLYGAVPYNKSWSMEPLRKVGANLLDTLDAEEEEKQEHVRQMEQNLPVSGINAQHVVTALEYLDDMFDFVGQTEQLLEFLDELRAFIGRFVDTSAWPSKETRVNAQGVDSLTDVEREITSWRQVSPAVRQLMSNCTR
ncbi:unnamed protein product, partial [Chrysoparadoxa australica]